MNTAIMYMSPNTTTKTTAMRLKKRFELDGHAVTMLDLAELRGGTPQGDILNATRDADLLGIGSPIYHMNMLAPVLEFLRYDIQPASAKQAQRAFLFATYGGITSGKAFLNTVRILQSKQIGLVGALKLEAPHFWKLNGFPTETTLDTIDEFYRQLKQKLFAVLDNSEALHRFSRQKLIVKLLYPLTHLIGKKRELPIQFDLQKCRVCKKCVRECPVAAIELQETPVRDNEPCIHCYHCTIACPFDAVICPIDKLKEMIALNKKIVGTEKPASEIYV